MKFLATDYQEFIARSRYARFLPKEKRRENWHETVTRYCDFFKGKFGDEFPYDTIKQAMIKQDVLGSMRALMTAGPALEKENIAGYNCSYLAVDDPRAFSEALYILMNGTGLGFSVERQCINKLPEIAESFYETDTVIKVKDSKLGWAVAFKELIAMLYAGQIPKWDLSELRPAGAPLKTFGGRSSGPEPLDRLFKHSVQIFRKAAGRRLTSIECHDLMCFIAEIVVVGGVRRAALISLSNLSDDRMRSAKMGQWWIENGQRALSNNSIAFTEKPEMEAFMKEWLALYESRSGERGIFNRAAAIRKMKEVGRRDWKRFEELSGGLNPCAEIFLRSCGFCNLSTAIVRDGDTLEQLLKKVELATILGTFQSTLTNFKFLRPIWKRNAEEERLLGVSLTGIMDHAVLSGSQGKEILEKWLTEMREKAIETNRIWAEKLGINQSVSITCVKPEGTVSQLVDASSGIHPRYSKYYIRTVRNDKLDPLAIFLKEQGVPCEDDVMKPDRTWVFSFPIKSPAHCVTADQIDAIGQLEHYLIYAKCWAEHNPSITVYVREHEWMKVGAWVYDHFDDINGVSFLPYTDSVYLQAPYQPCTEEEYNAAVAKMPTIDWSQFKVVEYEDNTAGTQSLACVSGVCEI
jgi:ribonucleoside-diphosphate reductase alpha chain